MALAPKDVNDLYTHARADLGAPDKDKALKWIVWAAAYLRQLTVFQGRVAAAEATDRAAAIRGETPVADACNDMLAGVAELHSVACQVRDLMTVALAATLKTAQPVRGFTPALKTVQGGKR